MHTYYTIRQTKDHFTVTLFDGHGDPTNHYQVWSGSKPYCTCPGYSKTPGIKHKHIQLVNTWLESGSPGFAALELINDIPTIIHTPYEIKLHEH